MSAKIITQVQGFVYERDIESVTGDAQAALEAEVTAMLAPTKEQRAASVKATARYADVAAAEAASHSLPARSLECRGPVDHPDMAPNASTLQSACDAAEDDADATDLESAFYGAHDIFNMLGTLADRFPRRARRTESGGWARAGVVNDTLDTIAYGFERRWEMADKDEERARRELRDAERAFKGGEIDQNAITQAEDRAVERQERAAFFRHLSDAARRSYELLVGTPWQSRQRMAPERAAALGLAAAHIKAASAFVPQPVAGTQRVIVMGGGTQSSPALADALTRLKAKYPALTLYSGNRGQGPEHQVARFCIEAKVQLIQFRIEEAEGRGAIFRRNERMFEAAKPHGLIIVGDAEHGPTDNLADLAKTAGVKIWDLRDAPVPVARKEEAPPVGA